MKQLLLLILISATLVSCNSCVRQLYGVHEPLTPYKTEIKIEKGVENLILQKIDSLNQTDTGICDYSSVELKKNDRVLCFTKPDCECYYLEVNTKKVTVYAVTIPEKREAGWLFYKEQLGYFRIQSDGTDKELHSISRELIFH